MIVAAPKLLSDEWMLIGRQEDTGFGGRIDLLAIAPDGALVLIELKRDKTPRDVVAQSLDYASWVEKLRPEDIAAIYGRFAPGRNLGEDFQQRFGLALDEDSLNESHQIIIVSASLDASTERIVAYLSERDIPINVLCFQVFANGSEQLISRTWLLDPVKTQVSAATKQDGPNEPWNGEFYHSFGTYSGERSWDDAVKYGFICGGGDTWYSRTLQLLNPGDRVWAKIPGSGFVGVGRVTGRAQRYRDFMVTPQKAKCHSARSSATATTTSNSPTTKKNRNTSFPSTGCKPSQPARPFRRSACSATRTPSASRRRQSGGQRWNG